MVLNIKQIKQDAADNAKAQADLKVDGRKLMALDAEARPEDYTGQLSAINVQLDGLAGQAATIATDLQSAERFADAERHSGSAPRIVVGADLAAEQPFVNLGEQLKAIHSMRTNAGSPDVHARLMAAAQGSGESVDSDGGYLLQPDFKSAIESRMFENGEILSRCREIKCGPNSNAVTLKVVDDTSRATGSRWGGVRGYWVDEGAAPTKSKPTFGTVELKLKKVAALGYASDELLEDAVAMSSIYEQAFAEELTFLTEDAVFNGDGAGKPTGVVGHASTVSVSKETGQSAATVVFANIVKMWARMWARSRSNAVWFINQDIEPQLFQMSLAVGTGGAPVYLPANGLSSSPFASLMGRPVVPTEYSATLGTVGDVVLGDLSQYGLLTKGGVKQASSMHVSFTTDEMAFRATYRVDGQPLWKSALTPFKGSTLSPTVTLATRS
tara:strand:+ start:1499 stop:2821 length:1323 start_codon:yes stop_codon:yes gene_type:complete